VAFVVIEEAIRQLFLWLLGFACHNQHCVYIVCISTRIRG